jgi:hypothetical protein
VKWHKTRDSMKDAIALNVVGTKVMREWLLHL